MSRLLNIRISYRAKYVRDWFDKVQDEVVVWEEKLGELNERRTEIRAKSIERARRVFLPKRLKSVSPLFEKPKVQPEDIKLISHPVDFVAFDGLVTSGNLRRIVLLESKASGRLRNEIQASIVDAVEHQKYDWYTLRVDESGKITRE